MQCIPNYIYNMKMLVIKEEWKVYEDAELFVSCSSRDYPLFEIRIGNKSSRTIAGIGIKEGVIQLVEN